jgi:hypothetical protein
MRTEKAFEELFKKSGKSWVDKEMAKFWFTAGTKAKKVTLKKYTHIDVLPVNKKERGAMHYVDLADRITDEHIESGYSERELSKRHTLSKSEVHRLIVIGRLSNTIKVSAKKYNTEKYVLLEWSSLLPGEFKNQIAGMIKEGTLRKRWQLKKMIKRRQS